MSAVTPGAITAPADARHGTQVLYRWAEWLRQHGFPRATRMAFFCKGEERLVVHEYLAACAILKIGPQKPKLKEFREWRQPIAEVMAKLRERGWCLTVDTGATAGNAVVTMSTTWQQEHKPAAVAYAVPPLNVPQETAREAAYAAAIH